MRQVLKPVNPSMLVFAMRATISLLDALVLRFFLHFRERNFLFTKHLSNLECPADTYKNFTGQQSCTSCPELTSTFGLNGSSSESACLCLLGYETVGSTCQRECFSNNNNNNASSFTIIIIIKQINSECQNGTYQDVPGGSLCKQCTTGASSPPGSTSISSCICSPGYEGSGLSCSRKFHSNFI